VLAAGCPKPTGLTTTPGGSSITLNWTAPSGAQPGYTYNVKRSTVSGGPYTTIAPGVNGTSYVDSTPANNTTYFYVVSAVSAGESGDCAEASGRVLPIALVPPTPIFTNENGTTATFNIQFNQPLNSGESIQFTIASSNGNEAQVSSSGQPPAPATKAPSINFTVFGPVAAGVTIPVIVTGINDDVADPPSGPNYQITVSFVCTQTVPFSGFTIPPIQGTNNDNDSPGITVSRTSGLLTTESGGTAQFDVYLNSQPTSVVNIATITSSNPAEGTVSPASLQFTTTKGQAYTAGSGIGGWDVAHTVTVTGVDDTLLDFTVPYTITMSNCTSSDPNYNFAVPSVSCFNLDNEVPPALPEVWGGGGCGLLGLEVLLVLLAARLRRPA
jgi:hypothetical protein